MFNTIDKIIKEQFNAYKYVRLLGSINIFDICRVSKILNFGGMTIYVIVKNYEKI